MHKSGWLLNRLQTGSFAILIMCGFGYLAALWAAPPRSSPFLSTDDTAPLNPGEYFYGGKIPGNPSPQMQIEAHLREYARLHPIASTSAFAYTVVVLVCMGLMLLASIAIGRILTEHNRKARGIIGWSAVMVGAWSLVLLTAAPYNVPCPAYPGRDITCSVASQAAAHWVVGLVPMCVLLSALPMLVVFTALRLVAKPSATAPGMAHSLV